MNQKVLLTAVLLLPIMCACQLLTNRRPQSAGSSVYCPDCLVSKIDKDVAIIKQTIENTNPGQVRSQMCKDVNKYLQKNQTESDENGTRYNKLKAQYKQQLETIGMTEYFKNLEIYQTALLAYDKANKEYKKAKKAYDQQVLEYLEKGTAEKMGEAMKDMFVRPTMNLFKEDEEVKKDEEDSTSLIVLKNKVSKKRIEKGQKYELYVETRQPLSKALRNVYKACGLL